MSKFSCVQNLLHFEVRNFGRSSDLCKFNTENKPKRAIFAIVYDKNCHKVAKFQNVFCTEWFEPLEFEDKSSSVTLELKCFSHVTLHNELLEGFGLCRPIIYRPDDLFRIFLQILLLPMMLDIL